MNGMLRQQTAKTLWLLSLIAFLGAWLVFAPATFGYGDTGQVGAEVERVTAERGLSSVAERGQWMTWSDIASGLALVLLAALSLNPRRYWSRWAACLVGVWLMFAPLVLWAPDGVAYLNGVLVGGLVIALTILIPEMPGMMAVMKPRAGAPARLVLQPVVVAAARRWSHAPWSGSDPTRRPGRPRPSHPTWPASSGPSTAGRRREPATVGRPDQVGGQGRHRQSHQAKRGDGLPVDAHLHERFSSIGPDGSGRRVSVADLRNRYRRRLFETTEALENAMAAPAMMGLRAPATARGRAVTL